MADTPLDTEPAVRTVRWDLDKQLAIAQKNVLDICIAKAKAEQLGMLDWSAADLREIMYPGSLF